MNTPRWIGPLAVAVFFVSAPRFAAAQDTGGLERPLNVLFIMSDQHNERMLGSTDNGYGGAPVSLTPNLDQLASEGARFENAFCSQPQCSPSRWTLVTGRWPHEHGVRWNEIWEPRGVVTLPRLARAAGYVTGTIGKHHFLWLDQQTPLTEDHGFDLVLDEDDYVDYCLAHGQQRHTAPGRYVAMPGLPTPMDFTGFTHNTNEFHPSGYWADRAIEFLDARAGPSGDGKPFVLWYSMDGPHTPILPTGPADPNDWAHRFQPFDQLALPPNFLKLATLDRLATQQLRWSPIDPMQHREALSYYYGLIHQIDWNVGRVLERLRTLGLANTTLVVYTADHGEMSTEMSCWTKGTGAYDPISKVPLIMRLPGVVEGGLVTDELTSNVDIVPTLLELTGLPVDDELRASLEGESLVPIVTGEGVPAGWRTTVFTEFGTPLIPNVLRYRSAATKDSKYVFDELGGGQEEFYDLALDPFEIDDRIADPDPQVQATIAALRTELDAWWNGEQGHAPQYERSGREDALPSASAVPEPADGATDVARDVDPAWVPSTAAEEQDVFLGLAPSALVPVATLPAMADHFNPGTLLAGRDYYWRVDGRNDNGTTAGPVWSFRTTFGGSGGPGLASAPSPPPGATGVLLSTVLRWTPGAGASAQVLFFGRPGELAQVATLPAGAVAFPTPPLTAGTTYAWRVDGTDAAGTTEGTEWTFATNTLGLAGRARAISPLHLASGIRAKRGFTLSWQPGLAAVSYDVHVGTSFPPELRGNVPATSFEPKTGAWTPGTVVYWRVDSVSATGTTRGFTWRFRVE